MTKTDLNKQKTGVGTEKTQGTSSQTELGQVLSETPLTVEQQVAQLSKQVVNLSLGFDQVLGLLKDIVKTLGNTENMIENLVPKMSEKMESLVPKMSEKIDKVSKQVENITPTEDKIIHTILSRKNIEISESIGYYEVRKANMRENIESKEISSSHTKYIPKNSHNNEWESMNFDTRNSTGQFMIYCMNIFLNFKNEGIKINDMTKDDINGSKIFCTGQGYSWTGREIVGILDKYYHKYDTKYILEYILYLNKKYH